MISFLGRSNRQHRAFFPPRVNFGTHNNDVVGRGQVHRCQPSRGSSRHFGRRDLSICRRDWNICRRDWSFCQPKRSNGRQAGLWCIGGCGGEQRRNGWQGGVHHGPGWNVEYLPGVKDCGATHAIGPLEFANAYPEGLA